MTRVQTTAIYGKRRSDANKPSHPIYKLLTPRERTSIVRSLTDSEMEHGMTPGGLILIAGEQVSPWGAMLWLAGQYDEELRPTARQFVRRLTALREGVFQEAPPDDFEAIAAAAVGMQMMDWSNLALDYRRSTAFDRRVLRFLGHMLGIPEHVAYPREGSVEEGPTHPRPTATPRQRWAMQQAREAIRTK